MFLIIHGYGVYCPLGSNRATKKTSLTSLSCSFPKTNNFCIVQLYFCLCSYRFHRRVNTFKQPQTHNPQNKAAICWSSWHNRKYNFMAAACRAQTGWLGENQAIGFRSTVSHSHAFVSVWLHWMEHGTNPNWRGRFALVSFKAERCRSVLIVSAWVMCRYETTASCMFQLLCIIVV